MLQSAFDPSSIAGGLVGFTVVKTITIGFGRAIFATDAGLGLAPIIQSSAKTTHPVIDGLVALAAPFLVMVVCTVTGLVLLVTGVWQDPTLKYQHVHCRLRTGTWHLSRFLCSDHLADPLCLHHHFGLVSCGERAVEYLFGLSRK